MSLHYTRAELADLIDHEGGLYSFLRRQGFDVSQVDGKDAELQFEASLLLARFEEFRAYADRFMALLPQL